jgi:hypothetical protein
MITVQIQDWSAVLEVFEGFFGAHGAITSDAQQVGFTAPRARTGVTIHRSGSVAAYMPLHEVELQARRLMFDEEHGELRVESEAGRYLYRRPGHPLSGAGSS